MERAAHVVQSYHVAEELQPGSRHGREGSDMMARISVCPQRPAGTLSRSDWMERHASLPRICGVV